MDILAIVVLIIIAVGGILWFTGAMLDHDHFQGSLGASVTFLASWGISSLYVPVMERLSGG